MCVRDGEGELRFREDVTQTALDQTLSSHLLQCWQAGLDDCFAHSYSGVSTTPLFDLLMFHHHWVDLGFFLFWFP